jgi:hypothetical protein
MLGGIVGLADAVGVERVGREDFGARIGKALADGADHLWLGDVQKIVVALLVLDQVEACAIGVGGQFLVLDPGAVRTVLDQDALRRFGAECLGDTHEAFFSARTPSRWQMA